MLFPQVGNSRLTRSPAPAHDLFEDLLDEIHGCHLLYGSRSDDEDKDEIEQLNERLGNQFANAVRTDAAASINAWSLVFE